MPATATYGADAAVSNAGPPVTMGPMGFWLDAQGNVAATDPQGHPQQTPGQRDNPQAQIFYDAAKDLNYTVTSNGQKLYQSPVSYAGQAKGTGHGMVNPKGSLLKGNGTWNPQSGTFDQGANWGNILSMVVAGVLTAGAADAIMGASSGTAAAAAGSGAAPGAAGGTAPVLEGIAAGPGAASVPAAAGAAYGPLAGGYGAVTTTAAAPAALAAVPGGVSTAVPAAASSITAGDILKGVVPTAGGIVSSIIQANASGKATDAQQAYLQQALEYEKQQDAINRGLAAEKVKLEAGRYATYSGNIQPYLDTGNAAESKAASLLGLSVPPRSSTAPAVAPAQQAAAPASDTVTMKAPDGSTKQVPASQVSYWLGKGATQVPTGAPGLM